MTVVTRFAPSPTGYLHIGGVRTALFNYLYAKRMGGQFLLRIEDTDRARSTQGAIDAILDGLRWVGLQWDGDVVYQSKQADRHRAAAEKLLAEGKAYRCYATPEELTTMREQQKAKGEQIRYDGRWRDRDPKEAPAGVKPSIRLRAPQEGETVIHDLVQGPVTVANAQLDDMVLLRGDGTPTYMLAVVVDDIDMGITHVIRGDDHLNNAFRQYQLIAALGHAAPQYAHIPLIHGADGAKLSKRHGAEGVEFYRDHGFLPEALRNYLLRLGWSHGDDEIISDEQAIAWFDIVDVNRGAARFDQEKLASLNAHYMRLMGNDELVKAVQKVYGAEIPDTPVTRVRLRAGMESLKLRAKTINELAEAAAFYVRPRPIALDDKAKAALADGGKDMLRTLITEMEKLAHDTWRSRHLLEEWAKAYGESSGQKLGVIAQPLRAALCGKLASPPIFEVLEVLDKDEAIARMKDAAAA